MWSSEQDSNTTNPNSRNHKFGASSSSSRSSLSSSGSMIFPQTPGRSMEDVWKDISLMTPLQNQYHENHRHQNQHQNHHHDQHHNHFHLSDKSNPSFKGMILQDFLAGPLNRPPSMSPPVDHTTPLPPIPTPNLPLTSLSLNTGLEFSYSGNSPSSNSSSGDSKPIGQVTDTSSFISPVYPDMIMDPASPANIVSLYSNKRVPDGPPIGGDRRHKRMIKNRESAARSRARKQACTSTKLSTIDFFSFELWNLCLCRLCPILLK
jgi:hypothetical protein